MRLNFSGPHGVLSEFSIGIINDAINLATLPSSGSIHVHLDKDCDLEVLDRAVEIFNLFEMNKLPQKQGVLLYVCIRSKQFAMIADAGITSKMVEGGWQEIIDNMTIYFKSGDLVKAILDGVESAGKKLQLFFPAERV